MKIADLILESAESQMAADLAKAMEAEFGKEGEQWRVKKVETGVEKEKDDESTEVEAEQVEGEASDALLSPNR